MDGNSQGNAGIGWHVWVEGKWLDVGEVGLNEGGDGWKGL